MKITQSPLFYKQTKKLKKNIKYILDHNIKKIIENPKIGNAKKGDLAGIFVYKFKAKNIRFTIPSRG